MAAEQKVKIIHGDIFKFTKGVLVIPQSTSGTINDAFKHGLQKLGIVYEELPSELGTIHVYVNPSKKYRDLYVVYATSVNNNASDYSAIARIAIALRQWLQQDNIKLEVYCPLLGTGAGGLDPFFALVYLALPFASSEYSYQIVIHDLQIYSHLAKQNCEQYHLVRAMIEQVCLRTQKDPFIADVVNASEFFFEIAQEQLLTLRDFPLAQRQKKELLDYFLKFEGNFQELITQSRPEIRDFLLLMGEVISYLDTKAYNRNEWNKYVDKRAIARANIRQNDWVKNLIIFTVERDTAKLPPGTKNAINYLLTPDRELPIISERDRQHVMNAIAHADVAEKNFNLIIRKYFENLAPRPANPVNWGVVVVRILYSPLVRLLWDPDIKKPKETTIVNIGLERDSSIIEHRSSQPDQILQTKETTTTTANANSAGNTRDHNNTNGNEGNNGGYGNNGHGTKNDLNEGDDNHNGQNFNSKKDNNNGDKDKTYKARLHDDRYSEEDLLDYQLYAQTIVSFIQHEDTKAPLTIGVFAPWGMGKTTLMKFIEKRLNPKRDSGQQTTSDEVMNSLHGYFNVAVRKVKQWLKIRPKEETERQYLTVQQFLDELRKPPFNILRHANYQYPTIWFNAWKYDNTEQILSGLAYEIITQLVDKLPNQYERERFYVNLNKKRFNQTRLLKEVREKLYAAIFNEVTFFLLVAGLITIPIVAYAISSQFWYVGVSGFSLCAIVNSLIKWAREKTTDAAKYFNSFVTQPKYEEKLGYFHEVEADMKKVFDCMVNEKYPCVIFIDDLDRCSSKKVVEVIEAINLFINGDFPNCYFIIGMDSQMVAASIEASYSDIDKRLTSVQKVHGSLGWYFLEKFVQLQFIIPNLSDKSGRTLLRKLFEERKELENGRAQVKKLKQKAQMVDVTDKRSLDEFAIELDEVGEGFKEDVLGIKATLIDRAAQQYTDTEKDAAAVLENYAQYLIVSPRVIKRFANLFRFYRFMQMSNLSSKMRDLTEDEIARMVIISLRWPQLPRLIQWNTESDLISGNTTLERAIFLDDWFERGWMTQPAKESMQWLLSQQLKSFISDNKIALKKYVEVGVW